MGWFLNLKTGQKLAIAFGLCLFLAAIVGATAISRMAQMKQSTDTLNTDSVAGFKSLRDITDDSKEYRLMQYAFVMEDDQANMQRVGAEMSDKLAEINKDFTEYSDSATQDEDKANFTEFKSRWDSYMGFQGKIAELASKNQDKAAHAVKDGHAKDAFQKVADQLEVMAKWNSKRAATLATDATNTYYGARAIVVALLAIAILIGIFMAITVTRIISNNLKLVCGRLDAMTSINLTNLGAAVDSLAAGDLSTKVVTDVPLLNVESHDEFGTLATTVNSMIARTDSTIASFVRAQDSLRIMAAAADEVANGNLTVAVKPQSEKDTLGNAVDKMIKNLSKLIAQTRHAAETINVSAEEVSAGNRDLSQRTEEQASSLEETAASMEEMTSTVKQNADNSRQANQLASHARELAEKGGAVVNDAVGAMGEINQGSKKIAEIISVIDEIAFQTNLLARNASVEAARVG